MMIPEAWENHASMSPEKRAFYRFHASLMEPWDGPASIAFTDGTVIGAVLDRNGLRPSRYWVTDDDRVIMASETGVVPRRRRAAWSRRAACSQAACSWWIRARGASSKTASSRLNWPASIRTVAGSRTGSIHLNDLPARKHIVPSHDSVRRRQQVFGYTHEELKLLVAPMAREGSEAIGSMGTDTPLAVLSDRPRVLFDYFQQLFAQVTNPPLDAIREELVTSLSSTLGPKTTSSSLARTRAARSSCHFRSSTTTTWRD